MRRSSRSSPSRATASSPPPRCPAAPRPRPDRGPLRLVGRIKWMIDPEYRGVGLGTMLVNQFIDIGRENGLRHMSCMLISDLEADAVKTLQELGFESYVVRGYGTDPDGNQH